MQKANEIRLICEIIGFLEKGLFGLKIPVSAVRFCPSAPIISRICRASCKSFFFVFCPSPQPLPTFTVYSKEPQGKNLTPGGGKILTPPHDPV